MFTSLLIANRGEIARRIIRTAKRLGIRTVAVYSDADAHALFVREADEALRIGGPAPADSYLNGSAIIDAARQSGAKAVHPGYGFLSESAEFAERVMAAGLIWVGAPPHAIRAMAMKDEAKRLMQAAGVPVTPGYFGSDQDPAKLAVEAETLGFPVLIKAVAGGGGRGMRRVDGSDEFMDALAACRREASGAFGDDRVLIEKYARKPRHIEVQVFGDSHGNIVHLFERDCSIQRRHQKVIEETPAPGLGAETRAALCKIAVDAARAVSYVGAGTVEFIADASDGLRIDRIWFMEMNTRLQVEHPVTEAVTGEDLVEWQLRVAAGEPLLKRQGEIAARGAAIEARLYAEDSSHDFAPSTGVLSHFKLPAEIRCDSAVEQGDEVSPYYDAMLAKLIVHEADRGHAAGRLAEACSSVESWPVKTNAAFLARILSHRDFLAGGIDTAFLATHPELLATEAPSGEVIAAAAKALVTPSANDPWTALAGFRAGGPFETAVSVRVGEATFHARFDDAPPPSVSIAEVSDERVIFQGGQGWAFGPVSPGHVSRPEGLVDGTIEAHMPGRIVSIDSSPGSAVTKGDRLMAIEAMKMEHVLQAPFSGTVATIFVRVGDQVVLGAKLAVVEKSAEQT
jgi:3-methylcrotonyl-CoA carboxylase alpha subunit